MITGLSIIVYRTGQINITPAITYDQHKQLQDSAHEDGLYLSGTWGSRASLVDTATGEVITNPAQRCVPLQAAATAQNN